MAPGRWRRGAGSASRGSSAAPRTASRRRSGPSEEEQWWDPVDQAIAERPIISRRTLGKRWLDVPMMNNTERLDPFGDDIDSSAVRYARAERTLTALDEGQAWRHRDARSLVVARVERFADGDESAHRAAWRQHGTASLDATWRQRWVERDHQPGWIEARWVDVGDRPGPLHAFAGATFRGPAAAVDWIRVEDHTDPTGTGTVLVYEHLTLWAGRSHAVLVVRHELGTDVDDLVVRAVVTAVERMTAS